MWRTEYRPDAALVVRGEWSQRTPLRLAAVETVYAMTVHKSQGSQFDTAAVVLPPPSSRLLTRELLVTGLDGVFDDNLPHSPIRRKYLDALEAYAEEHALARQGVEPWAGRPRVRSGRPWGRGRGCRSHPALPWSRPVRSPRLHERFAALALGAAHLRPPAARRL